MAKRLYVGNLPWTTTSADLEQMFAAHGSVCSAEVISDREQLAGRGFGFVEMDDEQGMNAAIQALNGQNIGGRPLTVNEAREKDASLWRRWRRRVRRRRSRSRRPRRLRPAVSLTLQKRKYSTLGR